jgi:hypothetical protein
MKESSTGTAELVGGLDEGVDVRMHDLGEPVLATTPVRPAPRTGSTIRGIERRAVPRLMLAITAVTKYGLPASTVLAGSMCGLERAGVRRAVMQDQRNETIEDHMPDSSSAGAVLPDRRATSRAHPAPSW